MKSYTSFGASVLLGANISVGHGKYLPLPQYYACAWTCNLHTTPLRRRHLISQCVRMSQAHCCAWNTHRWSITRLSMPFGWSLEVKCGCFAFMPPNNPDTDSLFPQRSHHRNGWSVCDRCTLQSRQLRSALSRTHATEQEAQGLFTIILVMGS